MDTRLEEIKALAESPELSGPAFKILCILLFSGTELEISSWKTFWEGSNGEGLMLEGANAIQGALRELEDLGYLVRIRLRDRRTNRMRKSCWIYDSKPISRSKIAARLVTLSMDEKIALEKRWR